MSGMIRFDSRLTVGILKKILKDFTDETYVLIRLSVSDPHALGLGDQGRYEDKEYGGKAVNLLGASSSDIIGYKETSTSDGKEVVMIGLNNGGFSVEVEYPEGTGFAVNKE